MMLYSYSYFSPILHISQIKSLKGLRDPSVGVPLSLSAFLRRLGMSVERCPVESLLVAEG